MFLAWNPFAAIGDTILSFLVGILLFLDALIYSLISWVYQIILVLCNVDILNNNFEINNLIGRIYIILGVIVLFLVAYSLLKSMANPDEALKGKKSPVTIIKDVLISIVLIAIIPSIFEFAYGFQSALLTKNTLGSIILGTSSKINGEEINSEDLINNGGMTIATGVLNAFLHENYSSSECIAVPVSDTYPNGYNCDNVKIETTALDLEGNNSFRTFWSKMQNEGSLLAIVDLSDNIVKDGTVTYYYIISTVAGVFVLFVLLSYCFDIAVRAVKLAVFELIAPLPILARIIPNEQANKTFSNWLKATLSTYIEVFIRLAILFFAVLIIKIVIQNFPSLIAPLFQGQAGWTVALFAQMFLIIGIIMFVKQAPGIIKDITGLDSGKYGKSLMRGIGMMGASLGGGATAAIRSFANDNDKPMHNRIGRALSAGASANAKGIWNGRKTEKFGDIPKVAGKTASDILNRRADMEAAGGTGKYLSQWITDKKNDVEGWVTGSFEAKQKVLDEVNAFLKDAKAVKSTTEGLVRDKKYLFNIGKKEIKDQNGNVIGETTREYIGANGKKITLDENTSLSAVEAMIESLKNSGDIEDARLADKINNDMQLRIKDIGKAMATAAVDRRTKTIFNAKFMVDKKDIETEAAPTLATAASQYEIVEKRYKENSSLDAVVEFKSKEGNLQTNNVSKLADQLEIQAAEIQQEIKLEQERRKAKDKK